MKKYVLGIGDKEYTAELKSISAETVDIIVNGVEYKVALKQFGRQAGSIPQIRTVERAAPAAAPAAAPTPKAAPKPAAGAGGGIVNSPLPGLILEIKVAAGASVKAGQDLLIMEAMKMENQVQAPHDGTVKQIFVNKGDSVSEDDPLVEIERSMVASL